jgi:hypothetical protein
MTKYIFIREPAGLNETLEYTIGQKVTIARLIAGGTPFSLHWK